jgi:hypothetical protein
MPIRILDLQAPCFHLDRVRVACPTGRSHRGRREHHAADATLLSNETLTRSRLPRQARIIIAVARDATEESNWSEVTAHME